MDGWMYSYSTDHVVCTVYLNLMYYFNLVWISENPLEKQTCLWTEKRLWAVIRHEILCDKMFLTEGLLPLCAFIHTQTFKCSWRRPLVVQHNVCRWTFVIQEVFVCQKERVVSPQHNSSFSAISIGSLSSYPAFVGSNLGMLIIG